MTKEEYVEKLMAQFGDETLIPETKPETQETQATEESASASADGENAGEVSEVSTESTNTGDTGKSESGGSDSETTETSSETSETSSETSEDDLINPENGKKFSHKKVKKTIWENKHLAKQVAELKRQLEEMRAYQAPKEEAKLSAPVRSQFSSDEEYTNAAFAYNLQLLAQKNKERVEEQMAAARFLDEKQRVFQEKVSEFIPEAKLEEFDGFMRENYQDLCESLTMDAQNDIVTMSTTPLILWKLGQSPDLISAVNRMNPVERVMLCNKIAEQMKSELSTPPAPPKQKAPVVGKVGTGKAATRNMEEMSPDEMYSYFAKRLSGG